MKWVGCKLPFHPSQSSRVRSKHCERQRAPGMQAAPRAPRSPVPVHSHLQRTVGSIDKAKVLGFCQDHEGTLLMALRERDRVQT